MLSKHSQFLLIQMMTAQRPCNACLDWLEEGVVRNMSACFWGNWCSHSYGDGGGSYRTGNKWTFTFEFTLTSPLGHKIQSFNGLEKELGKQNYVHSKEIGLELRSPPQTTALPAVPSFLFPDKSAQCSLIQQGNLNFRKSGWAYSWQSQSRAQMGLECGW